MGSQSKALGKPPGGWARTAGQPRITGVPSGSWAHGSPRTGRAWFSFWISCTICTSASNLAALCCGTTSCNPHLHPSRLSSVILAVDRIRDVEAWKGTVRWGWFYRSAWDWVGKTVAGAWTQGGTQTKCRRWLKPRQESPSSVTKVSRM